MRYIFTLTRHDDNRESYNLVEAPEWVVPLDLLVSYAQQYGNLSFVESMNFHDFYQQSYSEERYREMFAKMRVLPRLGDAFSDLEWKLANLYRTVVFQKKRRR